MMGYGPSGNPYRRPPVARQERHLAVPGDPGRRHRPMDFGLGPRDETAASDPDLARLVAMGFRPNEVTKVLAKARSEGEPDVVRYVLGAVIQGVARR